MSKTSVQLSRPKPHLNLNDKDIQGIKGKTVGDKVQFVVEGKIKSMNQYENEPVSYGIELSKTKMMNKDRWGDYKKYLK
jgi:hypothetical protein